MNYNTLNGTIDAIDTLIADCDFLIENFDSHCMLVTGRSLSSMTDKVRTARQNLIIAKENMKISATKMNTIKNNVDGSEHKDSNYVKEMVS